MRKIVSWGVLASLLLVTVAAMAQSRDEVAVRTLLTGSSNPLTRSSQIRPTDSWPIWRQPPDPFTRPFRKKKHRQAKFGRR